MGAINASGFYDFSNWSFEFVAVSRAWFQFRAMNSGLLVSSALELG